jgi:hypothetical protein
MKRLTFPKSSLLIRWILMFGFLTNTWANSVVWSCSRSEPKQTIFEGIRVFRIEKLSVKDDSTISITLMDLYAAYAGEIIQVGKSTLAVCSLPPSDPVQISAMAMLGYSAEDLIQASKRPKSPLILIPSIHQMHKCLNENHPAVGFFQNTVETEHVGPCF